MKVIHTELDGAFILEPEIFQDERGFFSELSRYNSFHYEKYSVDFVQDNHSRSLKNVLRGLHFNRTKPQAQLVSVLQGEIYDVVVDLRRSSTTFGRWTSAVLSEKGPNQIFMAEGFAHGFCVLSETADLHYKVSEIYDAEDQAGLLWSDKTVNIQWPISNPIINKRDQNFPSLTSIIEKQSI